MIIALRDGYVVVVVFQLDFTVIVEQVIEQFLVVRSAGMISSLRCHRNKDMRTYFSWPNLSLSSASGYACQSALSCLRI